MPNLDRIAAEQERLMLQTFNAILGDIKNQAVLQEIVKLLEVGNVDGVIELLGLDETTWQPLGESIRDAYRTGGITGAVQIGTIPTDIGTLVMRFNVNAPLAQAWLSQASSRLITEIVEDQRQMVRERLTAALERGDNPRTSALELVGRINPQTKKREGGFIGLTSQQASWIDHAREELENLDESYFDRKLRDKRLDGVIMKAIRNETPIPKKTINAALNRMQQRALKYRGDVISRTESINALRAGQYASIIQAIEKGDLVESDVVKSWDSSGDARTRLTHLQAENDYKEGIPLNQPFMVNRASGFGVDAMMYPGDPSGSAENVIQCRCKLIATIDFGAKLARIEGFA